MIQLDLSILNQKGTPMFNSDTFANRPNFGIVGRIFISTDTSEIYRDTGTSWVLIADTSAGGTITGSGTTGTIPIWSGSTSLGNSIVTQSGVAITISGTAKANNYYVGSPTDTTRSFAASGDANTIALWLEEYGGVGTAPDIFMNRGRGSQSSKVNVQVGDGLGGMTFAGYLNNNLNPSISFGAPVVNINTNDNLADANFELQQTFNSTTFKTNFLVRAIDGFVVAPNGGFENSLTKTAIVSEGWYGISSVENITIPANTSFNNLGFSAGSYLGVNLMTYQGNATFANGNGTTSVFGTNGFQFSSGGSTITINQRSTGINAYAGVTAFNYINGTNNGTISHLAGFHVLAPYQTSSAILSVTNYYGALINASDERTAFAITNRFGIYQEGVNDKNYFSSKVLIGSNVDNGSKLQVTGNATFSQNISAYGISSGNAMSNEGYYESVPNYSVYSAYNFRFFAQASSEAFNITGGGVNILTTEGFNNPFTVKLYSNGISTLQMTNGASTFNGSLTTNGTIRVNGQISPTSGGNSGQHLIINLDGTQYKIKLENN